MAKRDRGEKPRNDGEQRQRPLCSPRRDRDSDRQPPPPLRGAGKEPAAARPRAPRRRAGRSECAPRCPRAARAVCVRVDTTCLGPDKRRLIDTEKGADKRPSGAGERRTMPAAGTTREGGGTGAGGAGWLLRTPPNSALEKKENYPLRSSSRLLCGNGGVCAEPARFLASSAAAAAARRGLLRSRRAGALVPGESRRPRPKALGNPSPR